MSPQKETAIELGKTALAESDRERNAGKLIRSAGESISLLNGSSYVLRATAWAIADSCEEQFFSGFDRSNVPRFSYFPYAVLFVTREDATREMNRVLQVDDTDRDHFVVVQVNCDVTPHADSPCIKCGAMSDKQ